MPNNNKETKNLSILITMSLQNDFIDNPPDLPEAKEEINAKYDHFVHISYDECQRLWSNGKLEKFIRDAMELGMEYKLAKTNKKSISQHYHFVHIRDWHDDVDPDPVQTQELKKFGKHCIKGTSGARFISPLHEKIQENREFNLIVNSDSLNSFVDTNLDLHLESILSTTGCNSKEQVQIGIIGVATNIKVMFLAYDLAVRFGYPNVYVCEDLCAGFSKEDHEQGLQYIEKVLEVQILPLKKFQEQLKLI
ncbi:MAG: cysteine hydrolase family protein [Candidatus Hodarchaeota archaeon]